MPYIGRLLPAPSILLPFAHFLHQAGFSVLTYNMRSRGGSGGTAVSLGALEQRDLVSTVDFLAAQPETQSQPVGAWGISLGGATSILAAAQDTRIRAVVDDSGFSDAPNVIQTAFSHLPAFPFAPLTVGLSEERIGVSITDVRPMDVIGRISPRPILMIHFIGDALVPPDNTQRNLSRARASRRKSGGFPAATMPPGTPSRKQSPRSA